MATLLTHSITKMKTFLGNFADQCARLSSQRNSRSLKKKTFWKLRSNILHLVSFNGTLKPLYRLEMRFSTETRILIRFLSCIYVEIIKFYFLNYRISSRPNCLVMFAPVKRSGFESCPRRFPFFSELDIMKVMSRTPTRRWERWQRRIQTSRAAF